jgi:hypothetical protein
MEEHIQEEDSELEAGGASDIDSPMSAVGYF